MNFNGFEVAPVGNATIGIINNELKVSNIGPSGLDGVTIQTEGHKDYKVYLSEIPNLDTVRGVLKYTTLMKNCLEQVVTTKEQFEWYDPNTNKIMLGFNLLLLPPTFNLFGKLGGNEVFDFEMDKDDIPPPDGNEHPLAPLAIAGFVVAVAALGVAVYAALKPSQAKTVTYNYDAQGRYTGCSVAYTKDPTPFEVRVDNQTFVVDEFGIKFDTMLPLPLPDNSECYKLINSSFMITASKIGEFTITSIEGDSIGPVYPEEWVIIYPNPTTSNAFIKLNDDLLTMINIQAASYQLIGPNNLPITTFTPTNPTNIVEISNTYLVYDGVYTVMCNISFLDANNTPMNNIFKVQFVVNIIINPEGV